MGEYRCGTCGGVFNCTHFCEGKNPSSKIYGLEKVGSTIKLLMKLESENDQLKAKLKIAIDALKVMEDLHAEGTINIPDSVWEQCLYQALEQTQESE